MNDLESRIRDEFHGREGDAPAFDLADARPVAGRTRRRQILNAAGAGVGALAIVVALTTGLGGLLRADRVPADRPPAAPLSGPVAYDDLQGHVNVAGLDGSDPVPIADLVAMDDECPGDVYTNSPSWSPDGRYLAFRRFAECGDRTRRDVVIADLQGNVVGVFPAPKLGYEIGWSPDSTRVAVWDEYGFREGTYTIGIHGIDGSGAQFVMPRGWAPSWSSGPIWTADGDSVIVSELEVPLDGGTPREVAFHGTFMDPSGGWWQGALAYSPDGSQMAYGTPEGLMVARADGSDPREVSADGAHTAAWSPTGELIAVASATPGTDQFTKREDGGNHEQAPDRLRIVDAATGSTTLLAEGGKWYVVIGFSPDGDRVLYGDHRPAVAGQPDGAWVDSIWSVRIDGSDARQIAVGTYTGDVRPAGPEGGNQR
jgi:dipeptidyl aminopeptidase/acylaminoacyl peptidase